MEKNQIYFSIDAEFHMLRHFEVFSEQSLKRISVNFTAEQIQSEIEQVGSRFHSSFATDISELLDQLSSYKSEEFVGENGNYILTIKTSQIVGDKGIIELDALSKEAQDAVFIKNNRGIPLKHLQVDQLPVTNTFVIILKPEVDRFQFITAFPGEAAMPLPFDSLEPKYKEMCQKYWDRHVFLEINKNSNTLKQ